MNNFFKYNLYQRYWNTRYSIGAIYSNNLSTFGEIVINKNYLFKDNLLQIGCGYCRDIYHYSKKWKKTKYFGIEFSDIALQLLNKSLDIKVYNLDFLKINDHNLKEIGKFDTILAHYFLHLFPKKERNRLMLNILNIIKKNGIIVASFISDTDNKFGKGKKIEENVFACYPENPEHSIFFANQNLIYDCANKYNLEIIDYREYVEKEIINNKIENTNSIYVEFIKRN